MSGHPSGRKLFFFLLPSLFLVADVVVDVRGSEGKMSFSHFTADASLTH